MRQDDPMKRVYELLNAKSREAFKVYEEVSKSKICKDDIFHYGYKIRDEKEAAIAV